MIPRLLLSIAFFMPLTASAQSLDADPARGELEMLLSGFEYSPTQEELESLGLDLQTALIEVAEDAALPQVARGRAINMLQYYPSDTTRTYIERALANEVDGNLYLLGRELQLVSTYAASEPEWTLGQIERFIGHEDVGVRTLTVEGLAALRTVESVRSRIDEHLLQLTLGERNATVKTALRQAIGEMPLVPAGRAPILKITAQ